MTDGRSVDWISDWFSVGPELDIALLFTLAVLGVVITVATQSSLLPAPAMLIRSVMNLDQRDARDRAAASTTLLFERAPWEAKYFIRSRYEATVAASWR
jgi:hypothetical protein